MSSILVVSNDYLVGKELISSSDVKIVQKYWFSICVTGKCHKLTHDFYVELFERYPEYKKYFTHEINTQADKLSKMLNIIVNGMDIWERIEPEIISLGHLHTKIGDFTVEDYDNIFETMFYVMEKYRDYEDQEAYVAWRNLFTLISETMMNVSVNEA